jgi:hypothetical protein
MLSITVDSSLVAPEEKNILLLSFKREKYEHLFLCIVKA